MQPFASMETGTGAVTNGHNQGRRFCCARLGIAAIILELLYSICAREAWSQTRIELVQLQASLRTLGRRVQALERFHRSIICGRMDSDLLKDSISIYPSACQPDRDRPPPQIDPPRLKATLVRPGVFRFEFEPPRVQRPLVLATPLKGWGSIPVDMATLRVADVSHTGFTIETFDTAGSPNSSNVSFFFVVLAEPPRAE